MVETNSIHAVLYIAISLIKSKEKEKEMVTYPHIKIYIPTLELWSFVTTKTFQNIRETKDTDYDKEKQYWDILVFVK